MKRNGAERRKMASLVGEVRYEQILGRGLRAFCVWKVDKEGFFTSRQRELHDKRYKDIKQDDVLDSTEHSEPVIKDEDGEGDITEGFTCCS